MTGEEVSAQSTTATRYARNQQSRLAARITSMRAGARGVSIAGLNLQIRDEQVPHPALRVLNNEPQLHTNHKVNNALM